VFSTTAECTHAHSVNVMRHDAPRTPRQRDRTSLRDGPSIREPSSPFVSKRLTTVAKYTPPSWVAFAAVNLVMVVAFLIPVVSVSARNSVYPVLGIVLGGMKVLDVLTSTKPQSSFHTRFPWAQQGIFYLSLSRTSMHVWLVWIRYQELNALLDKILSSNTISVWNVIDSLVMLLSNWQYHIACMATVVVLWGSEVPAASARDVVAAQGPTVVQWKKDSSVIKCGARILRAVIWCLVLVSSGRLNEGGSRTVMVHAVQALSLALEATVQQSARGAGAFLPRLSRLQCGALQCLYSLLNLLLIVF
jgi:hypothetical protein